MESITRHLTKQTKSFCPFQSFHYAKRNNNPTTTTTTNNNNNNEVFIECTVLTKDTQKIIQVPNSVAGTPKKAHGSPKDS